MSDPSPNNPSAPTSDSSDRPAPADSPGGLPHTRHKGKPPPRTRIADGIKTFLWVLPLTALIWVYAERQQIEVVSDIPVTIRVRTNAADRVVSLTSPENRQISLELKGPRSSLAIVRDALADKRGTLDVTLPDDLQPPFSGEVPIGEWIGRSDILTREAVTVSHARPATVTIHIEKKETLTVPVMIRPTDQAKIGGSVEFQPDKVTVEGPQSAIEGATPEVYADMKKVLDLPEGSHQVDVPVEVVAAPLVVVRPPATVKAIVKIRTAETKTLPQSIPVIVLIGGSVLDGDKYQFRFDKLTLSDVKVTGPPNAIESLDKAVKDERNFPAAIVDIAPRDLPGIAATQPSVIRRTLGPANFRMPKDVIVTSTDLEVTITVTLKPPPG